MKWMDTETQETNDFCCFQGSKLITRLLQHSQTFIEKIMEQSMMTKFLINARKRNSQIPNIGQLRWRKISSMHRIGRLKHGYQFWQKGGGHKKRFQYCFNPNYLHQFQYFRAVTVVPVRVLSGPASENSTHTLRQVVSWPTSQASTRCIFDGGFVICPVLLFLTKALSSSK